MKNALFNETKSYSFEDDTLKNYWDEHFKKFQNNSKKKKNDDLKIIGEVKPFRPKINL